MCLLLSRLRYTIHCIVECVGWTTMFAVCTRNMDAAQASDHYYKPRTILIADDSARTKETKPNRVGAP